MLNEFDEETKAKEEEAKKSAKEAEVKEEEKSEEVKAPTEVKAEEDTEEVEVPADAEVKEVPAAEEEVVTEEEPEAEKEVEEEEAEKAFDPKKKKEAKGEDEEDEEEDEDDKAKKAKKKKAAAKDKEPAKEEAKKSTDGEMVGLLEAVLKSYKASNDTQSALVAKIDSLETTVKSLSTKLAETTEEVAKSFDVAEIKNAAVEEVEDKAVGYVTKSASTEDLAPNETTEEVENEVTQQEAGFDPKNSADRSAFISKFKEASQSGKVTRGSLESYREAYLTAGEGRANPEQLQKLHEFIQ